MTIQEQQQARYASVNENKLILTAGLIQFVNVTDFVMVMPLGPDFARGLGIPTHEIGVIAGSYTFAAAFAGLLCSFFMDNFSRKAATLFFLAGIAIATLGGALAWNKESMLCARIIAGFFGGPLYSLASAIIADYVPPERRGKAMGRVMGSFSLASILGVPLALQLSQWSSWHAPFIATSVIGVVTFIYAVRALPYHPPFINHVSFRQRLHAIGLLLQSKTVLLSFFLCFLLMGSAFTLIPNISAHLQINWHYPREKLGLLYFIGGSIVFFTMRLTGSWVDKTSAGFMSLIATLLFIAVMLSGFIYAPNSIPVIVIFVAFMLAMTTRNIASQTVFSKIPSPELRGAYNALQTALTHLMQALAASASSYVIIEGADRLLHIDTLAWAAIGLSALVPPTIYYIDSHLKRVY